MDIFKNMHLFVEVAKANSFRRAADVLDMPNSTVSRRISDLERDVGLRLFNRTTRRVELTQAGLAYFENCKRIIQEAKQAHQELVNMQAQPSGVIRASMPVDFSVMVLSPFLADFAMLYPNIGFDLDLSPMQVNLVTDSVDLVIRMGVPKDPNAIAKHIACLNAGLYASPDYLAKHGTPIIAQDLMAHECLRMRDAPWILSHTTNSDKADIKNEGDTRQIVDVTGRFVANNVGMLRSLALGGQGIMMNADIMAQADCGANRLIRILPEWSMPSVEAYALTATRLLPAKVRVFMEFLVEKMAVTFAKG